MLKAPAFTLPDQDGMNHSLINYHGKWVILYFYPADDTPGCTTEACGFRDAFDALAERKVQVLGVSKDSVESHKKFAAKYNLNFPLLSDESKEIIKAYGAWSEKKFMGRPGILRKTFLINPNGEIMKEYPKVDPAAHITQILIDLEDLQANSSS